MHGSARDLPQLPDHFLGQIHPDGRAPGLKLAGPQGPVISEPPTKHLHLVGQDTHMREPTLDPDHPGPEVHFDGLCKGHLIDSPSGDPKAAIQIAAIGEQGPLLSQE